VPEKERERRRKKSPILKLFPSEYYGGKRDREKKERKQNERE